MESNRLLENIRALIYEDTPECPIAWLPLMEMAKGDLSALDYLAGYGCKYKSIRSCRGAATRQLRSQFREDPIKHLTPDTSEEFYKAKICAIKGVVEHPHPTIALYSFALFTKMPNNGTYLYKVAWQSATKHLSWDQAMIEATTLLPKLPFWGGLDDGMALGY
jgi:hypothetical protein